MKLKLDEQGHVVVRDGKPVYVQDDGKEVAHDAGALLAEVNAAKVGRHFAGSRFVSEQMAIPADMSEAYFLKNFRLENGKPVGIDDTGRTIYSRKRPGEVADFDEAMEVLVSSHPNRDLLLKQAGTHSTLANSGGSHGTPAGARVIARAHFDKLNPHAQRDFIKSGGTLTD